jgi:nascent polypeptide-associated complex subunit alpha
MMMPGMDPRMMKQAMKRMGIKQVEIDATEVIIRCPDKEIIIDNPSVSKVNMMGEESFQITGETREQAVETKAEINEEDIETVMEQAGVSRETALEAIEANEGDLAAAILHLEEKKQEEKED